MKTQKIKILIADDHAIFRDGLNLVLSTNNNYEVIGEANNGREVISLFNDNPADLILMDVTMQVAGGIDTARQILQSKPDIKIIFLTMHDDENTYKDAMSTGAHGYVLKKSGRDILYDAIDKVMNGGIFTLDENYL